MKKKIDYTELENRTFTLNEVENIISNKRCLPTYCSDEPLEGMLTIQLELINGNDYFAEFVGNENNNEYKFV